MNGYKCFWKGKSAEVYAETSYKAQALAYDEFVKLYPRRKVSKYDITPILCERGGEQVTHDPSIL